jgi:hypothetical protein
LLSKLLEELNHVLILARCAAIINSGCALQSGHDQRFETVFPAGSVDTGRGTLLAVEAGGFCAIALDFAGAATQTGSIDSVQTTDNSFSRRVGSLLNELRNGDLGRAGLGWRIGERHVGGGLSVARQEVIGTRGDCCCGESETGQSRMQRGGRTIASYR